LSEIDTYLWQARQKVNQHQADMMGNSLNVEIDNDIQIEEHEFHRLS